MGDYSVRVAGTLVGGTSNVPPIYPTTAPGCGAAPTGALARIHPIVISVTGTYSFHVAANDADVWQPFIYLMADDRDNCASTTTLICNEHGYGWWSGSENCGTQPARSDITVELTGTAAHPTTYYLVVTSASTLTAGEGDYILWSVYNEFPFGEYNWGLYYAGSNPPAYNPNLANHKMVSLDALESLYFSIGIFWVNSTYPEPWLTLGPTDNALLGFFDVAPTQSLYSVQGVTQSCGTPQVFPLGTGNLDNLSTKALNSEDALFLSLGLMKIPLDAPESFGQCAATQCWNPNASGADKCQTPTANACGLNGATCIQCPVGYTCGAGGQCVCNTATCPGCCTTDGICLSGADFAASGYCGVHQACGTCNPALGTRCDSQLGHPGFGTCVCDPVSCSHGCCGGSQIDTINGHPAYAGACYTWGVGTYPGTLPETNAMCGGGHDHAVIGGPGQWSTGPNEPGIACYACPTYVTPTNGSSVSSQVPCLDGICKECDVVFALGTSGNDAGLCSVNKQAGPLAGSYIYEGATLGNGDSSYAFYTTTATESGGLYVDFVAQSITNALAPNNSFAIMRFSPASDATAPPVTGSNWSALLGDEGPIPGNADAFITCYGAGGPPHYVVADETDTIVCNYPSAGPVACAGCWDGNGNCLAPAAANCGINGAACVSCSASQLACNATTGQCVCNSSSCGGCCDTNGVCQPGTTDSLCGQGIGACVTCPGNKHCTSGNCQ
jgi:hypothetical protein